MKKILTLTLLGCCLVPAHAEYKDGNQLLGIKENT